MEPPADLLAEIDFKFILTAPKESLKSMEQTMFLVEHAYWYYEDQIREKQPHLRHYAKLYDFAKLMFGFSPIFKPYAGGFEEVWERFNKYKRSIPVYGCIILDAPMERALLVRGLASASGWGFPRGKVNAGEAGIRCAARETLEETGIDVEDLLEEGNSIKVTADGKLHTLYIVSGIDPETTFCAPKTKGEIGAYGWHYIQDLPATLDEANRVYLSSTGTKHRFFMIHPFVRPLRNWIQNRKIELGLLPAKEAKKGGDKKAGPDKKAAKGSESALPTLPMSSFQGTPVPAMPTAALSVQMLENAPQRLTSNPLLDFKFDHQAIMRCFC